MFALLDVSNLKKKIIFAKYVCMAVSGKNFGNGDQKMGGHLSWTTVQFKIISKSSDFTYSIQFLSHEWQNIW